MDARIRHHRAPELKHTSDDDEPKPAHKHHPPHKDGHGRRRHGRKHGHQLLSSVRSPLKTLKSLHRSTGEQQHSAYVQGWLGQVTAGDERSRRQPRSSSPPDHLGRHSKNSALEELETLHKTRARREDRQTHPNDHARRPKRHASTDSSFVQPAATSPLPNLIKRHEVEGLDNKRSLKVDANLRKRTFAPDSESSSHSELPLPEEIFDKRRRHRTKKDRYDAKEKKTKAGGEEKTTRKKSKKVKHGDAAKISRAAGEELIRSFTSNKIARDRLTMRPGTGIFRNGKASSPSRKRGISDLAFSEMDFLSRSRNNPPAAEREVITSKHGQKVQKERERTRNEISTYFTPKLPSQVLESNTHYRRGSVLPSENGPTTVASSEFGGTSYMQAESSPRRRAVHKEQYLGFGTKIPSPRKFSLPPPSQDPIYYARPSVESERSEPSLSTSFLSWSETAKSPSRHGSPERSKSEGQPPTESSSPSVLRRRLLESGILDGLGLDSRHRSLQELRDRDSPATVERGGGRRGSPRRLSSSEIGSCRGAGHEEARVYAEDEPRVTEQLRQRQMEAARRAVESSGLPTGEDRRYPELSRNVLASRAYLRPSVSNVPRTRRPATTTPVRQRSHDAVLSRSFFPREVMLDSEPKDVSLQPSAEFDTCAAADSGQEREAHQDDLNLPPHGRTPGYEDTSQYQQLWAQDATNYIVDDQIFGVDYGDRREPDNDFNEAEQFQYGHAQTSLLEGEDLSEQVYYPDNLQPEEISADDAASNYCQPPPEPDPMNQYFQTPRGQSYFQQRGCERLNLQDESNAAGLLEEEQLKGFWATKRW